MLTILKATDSIIFILAGVKSFCALSCINVLFIDAYTVLFD